MGTPKTKRTSPFPQPPIFLEGEPHGGHATAEHIAWYASLPPDKHAAWCKMYFDWYQEAYGWLPQPMVRTKSLDVEKKKRGSSSSVRKEKKPTKPETSRQGEMVFT